MAFDWIIVGGLTCGAVAGGAARYGRLCTMSAVEDALIGRDYRGAKAWGLALAVAITATHLMAIVGAVDLSRTIYATPRLHILGVVVGGLLFGLGMTFVGTCSFGLLVRAGGGDLRAAVSAALVGVVAISATAGSLATIREPLLGLGAVTLPGTDGRLLHGWLAGSFGAGAALGLVAALAAGFGALAVADPRLRKRPRLLLAAVLMGLAIALGWMFTSGAVDALLLDRPESLSFVAPVGRALLQFMMQPFRNIGFGVATAVGVIAASFVIAVVRRELRWEAFDDATEMRRHLAGGAIMGIGGVLAQGCTIGQGMSAASTLAVSAPLFIASLLVGARIGLLHLIEGRALWRIGRT